MDGLRRSIVENCRMAARSVGVASTAGSTANSPVKRAFSLRASAGKYRRDHGAPCAPCGRSSARPVRSSACPVCPWLPGSSDADMERTRKPGDLPQARALPMSAADTPHRANGRAVEPHRANGEVVAWRATVFRGAAGSPIDAPQAFQTLQTFRSGNGKPVKSVKPVRTASRARSVSMDGNGP